MNWLASEYYFQIQVDYISDSAGVLDRDFRYLQIPSCFEVTAE